MTSPNGWDELAADIISRDNDLEEPPAFTSGHDAFLRVEADYEGFDDLDAVDE